jgi:hypothetical protein
MRRVVVAVSSFFYPSALTAHSGRLSMCVAVASLAVTPAVASAGTAPAQGSSSIIATTTSPSGVVTTATFPATTWPLVSAPPLGGDAEGAAQSAGSGTIAVDLDPTTAGASSQVAQTSLGSPIASVERPITCHIYLGQYVHYSVAAKDVSWHWTWACDGDVHLSANSVLDAYEFTQYYPVASGRSSQTGVTGDVNNRTRQCINTSWYGKAAGTFSAPNHLSRTFEGTSPTHDVKCS